MHAHLQPSMWCCRGSGASVTVKAEELASCSDWLHVTFAGKKLANKDGLFGKSDPFIRLKKSTYCRSRCFIKGCNGQRWHHTCVILAST